MSNRSYIAANVKSVTAKPDIQERRRRQSCIPATSRKQRMESASVTKEPLLTKTGTNSLSNVYLQYPNDLPLEVILSFHTLLSARVLKQSKIFVLRMSLMHKK